MDRVKESEGVLLTVAYYGFAAAVMIGVLVIVANLIGWALEAWHDDND